MKIVLIFLAILQKGKKEEEIAYEINKDLLPDSIIIINNYTEESLKTKLKQKYPDYSERQNELDANIIRYYQIINILKKLMMIIKNLYCKPHLTTFKIIKYFFRK